MRTYIVDSFTDEPFRGNPAGVCLHPSGLSDERMQSIAFELGLSETAFVRVMSPEAPTDPGTLDIRYFSPKQEIPLCGHATLAAARVVFDAFQVARIDFRTAQGVDLAVIADGDRLQMELPRYGTVPAEASPELLTALGITEVVDVACNEDLDILLVEIESSQALATLRPDFGRLLRSHDSIAGVLVTAASADDDYDFHSRYFWPWSGTDEDPVTGGTHTFLAPWWAEKTGRTRLRSFQSSERTGSMEVDVLADKVLVRANAVIVLEGQLRLGTLEPGDATFTRHSE